MLPFFLLECADLHCFLPPAAPQRGEVARFTMVTMLGGSMPVSLVTCAGTLYEDGKLLLEPQPLDLKMLKDSHALTSNASRRPC